MNKPKKTHKFFNVVVDEELLRDIQQLRQAGVNWQSITRNFLKVKASELKALPAFADK